MDVFKQGDFDSLDLTHNIIGVTLLKTYVPGLSAESIDAAAYQCEDGSAAQVVLNGLRAAASESTVGVFYGLGPVTAPCKSSGRRYVMNICGVERYFSMCIDCIDPCSTRSDLTKVFRCNSESKPNVQVLYFDFQEKLPAPVFTEAITTVASRTSVAIRAEVDAPGFVSCGVFPRRAPPINQDDLLRVGVSVNVQHEWIYAPVSNSSSSSNGTSTSNGTTDTSNSNSEIIGVTYLPVEFEVTGLSAHTEYEVYCIAVSGDGPRSSVEQMLDTKSVFKTECCRWVVLDMFVKDATVGVAIADAAGVSVESAPPITTTLWIDIYTELVGNGTESRSLLFPARFTVTHDMSGWSGGVVRAAQLLPPPATANQSETVYKITAVLSGSAAAYFNVVYPSGDMLYTRSVDSPLVSPPQLKSATFAPDGASITVLFSSKSNRGGTRLDQSSFSCSDILWFLGADHSHCMWADDRSITIRTPTVADVGAGSFSFFDTEANDLDDLDDMEI